MLQIATKRLYVTVQKLRLYNSNLFFLLNVFPTKSLVLIPIMYIYVLVIFPIICIANASVYTSLTHVHSNIHQHSQEEHQAIASEWV